MSHLAPIPLPSWAHSLERLLEPPCPLTIVKPPYMNYSQAFKALTFLEHPSNQLY